MAAASPSTESPENTFHDVAPFASSSTPLRQQPYDVFINHRGPDVKLNLASPIYHVLRLLGVTAFFDREELDLGDSVPQALQDAMSRALVHIAIFSKDYAASPWCLAELSFMLGTGAPIIPVFYDVQPHELGRLPPEGTYAKAFQVHKEKDRYKSERLDEWKAALQKVSTYTGIIQSNGDLGILLEKVGNRVQQEIKNKKVPFQVATYPVGLDNAVRDFEDVIRSARFQSVQIVGVVGTGGLGKTTLAREFYNQKFKAFDRCSFLSDVRDTALPELQKKLLEDLVHLRDISVKDASQLKSILAGRLRTLSPRVLIVLDDVDRVDQLDALLPEKGRNLGSGSLIIVTTRDSGVLRNWDISAVHKMRTLDQRHAKELFCLHAFESVSPPEDLEDLVNKFVKACDRLPLSLKVIAKMLYNMPNKEDWESEFVKISRLLPDDIKMRLKLSYDALDKEQKDIFLDVACFFVGEKKQLALAVWDAAVWKGLETLVRRCLVEIDKQNRIRMHNHLRDLGRQIAIECSPHRLWSSEQITKIMTYTQRMSIRGIMATTTQFVACPAHDEFPKGYTLYRPPSEECMNLKTLQLLVVDGDYFTSDFTQLSEDLVWLRLFDFQHENLPSWPSLKKLRVLELYGTSTFEQLWENNAQSPEELREMIITATEGNIFNSFPSIVSGLEHLTKIALISSHGEEFRFKELPKELCDLQSLEHLELRHCKLLSSLPDRFGNLTNLRHLDLCCCKELRYLPDSFQHLRYLKYLDLSGCKELGLNLDCKEHGLNLDCKELGLNLDCKELGLQPEFILKNLTQLENLNLSGCLALQILPREITNLQCLRELQLQHTNLKDIPSNIEQLRKLEVLTIGSPLLKSLPDSFGSLSSLKSLSIINCYVLESLPMTLERLVLLEHLCIEAAGKVRSIPGLRQLANLRTLKISDCPLSELGFGSVSPFSLKKLTVIKLSETHVTRISISQDCCPRLETLELKENDYLEEIETLPATVNNIELSECGALTNIKGILTLPIDPKLEISKCPGLEKQSLAVGGQSSGAAARRPATGPSATATTATPRQFLDRDWRSEDSNLLDYVGRVITEMVPNVQLEQAVRDNYRPQQTGGEHLEIFEPIAHLRVAFEERELQRDKAFAQVLSVTAERDQVVAQVATLMAERDQAVARAERVESDAWSLKGERDNLQFQLDQVRVEMERQQSQIETLQQSGLQHIADVAELRGVVKGLRTRSGPRTHSRSITFGRQLQSRSGSRIHSQSITSVRQPQRTLTQLEDPLELERSDSHALP